MHINLFDSERDVAAAVAAQIASAVSERPSGVLALATGRTPVAAYSELGRLHRSGHADFLHATFFGLDEFVGLGAGHPGSFRMYLERHLFSQVNFSRTRIHFLNGTADDLHAECARYEEAIAACGGVDLLMLGIGANGHIGFNEPGESLIGCTHVVQLHGTTRRDNAAAFGGHADRVPRQALSMGMATLLKAARIVLVATGSAKARCVERAVRGPLTTRLPASFLQTHRSVEVYLDREAASLLRAPEGEMGRTG